MNGAQNDYQQGAMTEDRHHEGTPPAGAAPAGRYGAGYQGGIPAAYSRKSPLLATFLSAMPGLGQVYVGYYVAGFVNIFVAAGTIAILASGMMRGSEPFFGTFLAFFWIFQMIDANRRAHHYNRVKEGLGGEAVPEGFEMPTTKGSLLGGAVLIILGILFILDLNFDVSMAWVENWWPLVLVLAGINLVYKARKKAD